MKFVCFSAVVSLCVVFTGCASNGSEQTQSSATLSFASSGSVSGVYGIFYTLDGKSLADRSTEVMLSAGRHTIGYSCPDIVTTDGPLAIKATFEAGKSYVLYCKANEPATVSER